MSSFKVCRTFLPSAVLTFLIVSQPAPAQVTCSGSDPIVLDCNGNGTDDFCDIAAGASADANTNGIPDECDTTNCLDPWSGFEPEPPFTAGALIDGIDFDGDGIEWRNTAHAWTIASQGCPAGSGKALKGVAQTPPTSDFVQSEHFHTVNGELDCGAAVYRLTFDARSEVQLNPRIDWRMSIRDAETNADVILIHWASTQSNYPGVGLAQGGNGRGRILVANPAGSPPLINTGFVLTANTCYTIEVVLDNVHNTVALSINGVLRVTTTRLSPNAARMDYFGVQQATNGQGSGGANRLGLDNFSLCTTGGAQGFPDCDGNCVDDAVELAAGTTHDCDSDGTLDACAIAGGTAADCNGNGTPDGCEIAGGTSGDCNTNGVPDGCDLAAGTAADCNANGTPDVCDIAGGASPDCNANGIPDGCELAPGYAADFEGGAGPEWSASNTDDSVPIPFTRFSGRFGNNAQDLILDVVPGKAYSLMFDLCLIDSWDGDGGPGFGPDYFNVRIDGALVFHETFSTYGAAQTYPFPASVGPAPFGWTAEYSDAIYRDILLPFMPSSASVEVRFQGQGLQTLNDESWGIDNVRVFRTVTGDCNSNGIPDECDIAEGTSHDCTGNGTPDECEPQSDCNSNGVGDSCDVAAGTSQDCNTNGVPDECEVGPPQVALYPIGADALVNLINNCGGGSLYNCGAPIGFTWTDATQGSVNEVRIELNIGVQCHSAGTPLQTSLNGLPAGTFGATSTFCTCSSTPGELVSITVPPEAYQTGGVNTFLVTGATTCLGLIPRAEFGGAYARVTVTVIGDCNGNGVPDDCDLAEGASQDCNTNGTPDECDFPSLDCNGNAVVDGCDIFGGTSQDCQENGVPDECDIAGGTSADCQPDGIPDECQLGGGVYLVSGHTADYGWVTPGWDSGYLIDNTLDWLWPTYAGSGPILLIWDNGAWFDSWRNALNAGGIPFTQKSGGTVTAADFDPDTFAMIVITEYMYDSSMPNMNALVREMEDYVASGGVLVDMIATNNTRRWSQGVPGPFGTVTNSATGYNSYVVAVGHGMVAGMSLPFISGSSDHHAQLVVTPVNSIVLLSAGQEPGGLATAAWLELHSGGGSDCNTNGIPDDCDIAAGTAADCNTNGLPDECDPDCNSNGLPDDCDIAGGTSLDCNSNAVPDECDLAGGPSLDCNTNGTPDECDLAAGTSADCNGSAIPDECEFPTLDCNANGAVDGCDIFAGTSGDCQSNGVPDECDIASGTSQDCTGDGTPDECQTDCNQNGAEDACDMAFGTSEDCNTNGAPDECDVGGPSLMWRRAGSLSHRASQAMAYDSARGVTVLFGGYDGDYDGETWEWNGSAWRLRATNGPSPRYDHAMAYDSARGVVVLFGGCSNTACPDGETWEWDGSAWSLRATTGPSPRFAHAMAYDSARGVTVLFGGYTGFGPDGETWEWDGSAWTLRSTSGPSPRYYHAMPYDSARGVTVLFGGYTGSGPDGETWEWDGGAWTLRATTDGISGPSPRYAHDMAYDRTRAVTVLFDGLVSDVAFDRQTWEWDGSTWSLRAITGPSPRREHSMAYDSARGVTVLFGGYDAGGNDGETWEWNGSAWMLRATTGPAPRNVSAMAHDSARGVTVLFGGCSNMACPDGETWEWDGRDWVLRSTGGPSPRYIHAMVYDSARGVTVLFGGCGNMVCPDGETWEWNGSTWTLVSTSGPSPRYNHAMAYDSTRGVTVLFGGCSNTACPDGETWEWNGNTWTLVSTSGPSPRYGFAMAYDSARALTVLFGGCSNFTCPDGETWAWDGSAWTLRSSSGPSPRYGHAMAFDSAVGLSILFGGCSNTACPDGETWARDGSAWTLRSTGGPSPRYDHAMAYDAARGRTVLFGGCSNTACPDGETWVFGPASSDCNHNATPDDCDIHGGGSLDANGNGTPDECDRAPAATVTSVVSRKVHQPPPPLSNCDIPINLAGRVADGNVTSEPRIGGLTELRISFDRPPGPVTPYPVTILQQTGCPPGAEAAFVPYSGVSQRGASLEGNTLVLTFQPGLENPRTYRFDLSPALTRFPNQLIEVRRLYGDVTGDGRVNAADRSAVVGIWTGPGFSCKTDVSVDSVTNASDRSAVVGAWTGGPTTNCAP